MKKVEIKGYEGLYEISEDGKVYSTGKGNSTCPFYSEYREIPARKKPTGYLHIKLFKNGVRKYYSIHRIVALNFIPNPENKPQVNHKDGNKSNNTVENLEWVTSKENIIHSIENGLQVNKKSFDNTCSIQVVQLDLNENIIKIWGSINDVKRELGYNSVGIIGCCKNKKKYKTAYGYKWKYHA
jgi:hypothetical protein